MNRENPRTSRSGSMRRDKDKLLRASELAETEECLLKRRGTDLSQPEKGSIDASREREQQEAARTEYREALTAAWKGKKLNKANVASLRDLVDNKLKLSPSTAAVIESEVMGDTIGGIL